MTDKTPPNSYIDDTMLEPVATKAEQKMAKKEAKKEAKTAKKMAKEEAKAAVKAKAKAKKDQAKLAKSPSKIKRFKRSYAHERSLVKSNPELKAAFLLFFMLLVVLAAFYVRVWVLNPQLQDNRRDIAQIPNLTQVHQASLLQAQQLKNQIKVIKNTLKVQLSNTPSALKIEPQLTEYLYVLQRFQIECDQYTLIKSEPIKIAKQDVGLISINLSYNCQGPFLSYLRATSQLEKLDAQIQVVNETVSQIENSDSVAINGQMTFVVNHYD